MDPPQNAFRGTWNPQIASTAKPSSPWAFVPPPQPQPQQPTPAPQQQPTPAPQQQQGYPPQGYPPQGQGYAPQGQGYPPQGYPPQGYAPQGLQSPPPSQPPPNTLVGLVCNSFTKTWDNARMRKKQNQNMSTFRVEPPEGYYRLGDKIEAIHAPYPSGTMLVIKESNPGGFPLLARPQRYVKIWDDGGTRCKFGDLGFYRPVAPPGYVALGDVAYPSQSKEPPLDYMRCVHSSVVVQGRWKQPNVWNDKGAGAKNGDVSVWAPEPDENVGGSNLSTFVCSSNYQPPAERPPWVLIGPRGQI